MEQNNKLSLSDVIKYELQDLMQRSVHLQHKILASKTRAKKNFFKNKLKKNNMKAMEMIVALEKLNKGKSNVQSVEADNTTIDD